ncbi:MAG: hypothetical protein HPY57_13285 [Ignavibacteria bacterium]|nr:hypothetical protein [Ignavibacteria bacterium]
MIGKLFESPDHLITKMGEYIDWYSDDAYVFGYYNNKMLVTTSTGKSHVELKNSIDLDKYFNDFNDMSLEDKHYFLSQYSTWSIETIKKRCKENTKIEDLPKNIIKEIKYNLYSAIESREELKYSGRLWEKHKYITFWDFPKDYKELWKVLNDIMDAFEKKGKKLKITDDWFIEVVTNEEGEQIENDYKWWGESEIEGPMEGYTNNSKIIKIKDYMGSVNFHEKERAIHLLSWAEKQKLKNKGWGRSWGSDLTAWDSKNPLFWRQAKYQENKHFQTSFKLFENPNDYGKRKKQELKAKDFGKDMIVCNLKNPLTQENAQFYYKKELNPKFWSKGMFNERIRQKLLTIANEFYNSFGYQAPIIDIILTGSLANYNWNKYSDLDVHVIIDFSKINSNIKLVKKSVDSERSLWNLKHNIRIKGHDVELYIQDVNEKHTATGQYSLLNNKWILKPTWNKPQIDEEEVNFKYLTYKSGIDRLEEISKMNMTPEIANKNYLFASEYKKKIHDNRKIGLEKNGEFSIENLVFKKLRNNGDFGRLMQIVNRFYDKIYTQ